MKRIAVILTVLAVVGLAATTAQASVPAAAAIQLSASAVSHGPGHWDHRPQGHYAGYHYAPPRPGWYRPPVVVPVPAPYPPPAYRTYYYAPPCNSVHFNSPGFSIGIGF